MDYRLSRYSYLFRDSSGGCHAFSTRSRARLDLEESVYTILQEAQKGQHPLDQSHGFFDTLRKCKFAVEDWEDDTYMYQILHESLLRSYNQDILSLVLAPTTQCNFRCGYCFEPAKDHRVMSDEVEDALIRFVEGKKKTSKSLDLLWYGGEPLMALERIASILTRIRENGLPLIRHSIITNGYYFGEKAIRLFKEFPLNEIQITFDGDRKRHNSIRKDFRTGAPSYDAILENTIRVHRELPETLLSVRVNIDRKNQEQFQALRQELYNLIGQKRVNVYPGILRTDAPDGLSLGGAAMERHESAQFAGKLINCAACGSAYPQKARKVCTANRINSYIIGPEGEIYKCWNDVTDPAKVVGSIVSGQITNLRLLMDYQFGTNWAENAKCRTCFLLPLCYGGCPWYRLRNLREGAHFNLCTEYTNLEFLQQCILSCSL